MKLVKSITAGLLTAAFLAAPFSAFAAEKTTADKPAEKEAAKKTAKAKPYPLKTCLVSDEKLGEMGQPYSFTYQGREIKTCCKDCKKDFDKDPGKFIKKLEAAEKKAPKAPETK